ncbi:hypothetical protein [Brevibacillus agri]|uniref:hypothetical protein n=1 Tax=Brevibacillus agri TaxID=51101 RepID=UPI0028680329|nr:hypothetical protein [Brevibacillus agri]
MREKIIEVHEELVKLIKSLGITHIYSYDDQWNKYKSGELAEYETKSLDEDLVDFFEKYSIRPSDTANRIISNNGFTTLQELVDSDIKSLDELIAECLVKINLRRDNRVLQSLDNLFKEIQKHGVIIEQKSHRVNYADVSSIDGKILFLLDMNMEETTGVNDVVIESILEIKESRPHNYDIVIVYSHEKLDFYEDSEAKAKYVEQYLSEHGRINFDLETDKYLFLHQLWALSKTPRIEELTSQLVNTLIRAAFGHSLHDYLELKLKSIKTAMLELIKTNETTFEYLYKDSFVEGELFLDILERTQKSILNKIETNDLLLTEYSQSLNNLFTISNLKNKRVLNEIVGKGIKNFRQETRVKKAQTGLYKGISEHGLLQYGVNTTYKDIMTGDVFKIVLNEQNIVKYGILITADCDLLIRFGKDIKEIKRKGHAASLLIFDGIPLEHEIAQQLIKDGKGLWPIKDEDNYVLINIEERPIMMNVDLRVLDLCSLNKNGWASLQPLEEEFINYKTYFFENYYREELSEWIANILNIDQYLPKGHQFGSSAAASKEGAELKIEDIEGAKDEVFLGQTDAIKELLGVLIGYKYFIKLNQEEHRFELRRIGRLEMSRTLQLIDNNLSLISRIGVPTNPLA